MPDENMQCPVCNNEKFSRYLSGKDYFLTGEPFNIIQCAACGFLMTEPVPPPDAIGRYYESTEYISHDAEEKNLLTFLYRTARFFTIRSKYRQFKKYSAGPRLLDIGCGTGEFLGFCKKKGALCSGIEPNPKARRVASEKYGLEIKDKISFMHEEERSYDCITMWHVLEHVHDLNGTLTLLRKTLKESGILILALPNPGSWDAKHYGEHWAAFDLPRHLYHFRTEHVEALANKYGFILKKILPQYLDAFYISMLSEKYRHGKKDPLRGVINGIRSNFTAPKPSFGYSSHIYILSANIS